MCYQITIEIKADIQKSYLIEPSKEPVQMRSSDNSKPQLRGQWGQPLAIEAIFGLRRNLFFIEAGNILA